MSAESKSEEESKLEEDKARIESEITRTKMALRPSTLLVMELKRDYSKSYEMLEFSGSSVGLPFLVRCFYLVVKMLWLYTARVRLRSIHRAKRS